MRQTGDHSGDHYSLENTMNRELQATKSVTKSVTTFFSHSQVYLPKTKSSIKQINKKNSTQCTIHLPQLHSTFASIA